MSIAILKSRAQLGADAPPVTIEVFLSGGLPKFAVVGMPETAVRESKDRVRGAIITSGFEFPQERITVSLGPADMRKTGGRFDLAIALGILAARKLLPADSLYETEFYGELALNGEIRGVPGVLSASLKAKAAGNSLVVPYANRTEAALAGARAHAAASLLELTAHLRGSARLPRVQAIKPDRSEVVCADLADVKGQAQPKRALEIAAVGGHNLLLIGPPGTGKSMLARRLPAILPRMTEAEALHTAQIESSLGRAPDLARWRQRPFRAPHHTASAPALVGGGPGPSPGEISRAHNGVLFLDELTEFNRGVLEVLREPIESGSISIARAGGHAEFPARFQLIAAMNPCPCGYLGDLSANCSCSADRISAYRGKISGPLLDRFDMHVEVLRPPLSVMRSNNAGIEKSDAVANRVSRFRDLAMMRQGQPNALLRGNLLEQVCAVDDAGWLLIERAAERFSLSPRSHHRILRVARTIADLAGDARICPAHLAEALAMRVLDRRI